MRLIYSTAIGCASDETCNILVCSRTVHLSPLAVVGTGRMLTIIIYYYYSYHSHFHSCSLFALYVLRLREKNMNTNLNMQNVPFEYFAGNATIHSYTRCVVSGRVYKWNHCVVFALLCVCVSLQQFAKFTRSNSLADKNHTQQLGSIECFFGQRYYAALKNALERSFFAWCDVTSVLLGNSIRFSIIAFQYQLDCNEMKTLQSVRLNGTASPL